MTIKFNVQLQQEILEHRTNTLRLFAEAKKIQQGVRRLPTTERQAAMDEVVALETEALLESHRGMVLETELIANQRTEIWRQNLEYLVGRATFRVRN